MKITLLAAALLSVILLPKINSTIPADSVDSSTTTAYQTIEHDGIRVTFLEMAKSQTPDGKHVSTSFLFLVENRSKTNGKQSHAAPIRFYDEKNNLLFEDASNGVPKTGCTVLRYEHRAETCLPPIPKPNDIEKARFVRHWIATRIPNNVAAVEAEFGIDRRNKTFRFDLHQTE